LNGSTYPAQASALPDTQGQRKFDAGHASAVFFKLRCLKLFDHDKMNAFPGSARRMQSKAGERLRGGMNGGFESWRDGPGN
jgi:hypothetical protein